MRNAECGIGRLRPEWLSVSAEQPNGVSGTNSSGSVEAWQRSGMAMTSLPQPDSLERHVLEEAITFDLAGVLAGARRCLPVALSVFAYGTVFGVLSRQAGLSLPETLLMSGLVFAGSAQFVALGLWAAPLPLGTLVLTTLIINLRHLLMGAALRPWFARLSPAARYGSLFFLTDENWALTMAEYARGGRNGAFLLGRGLAPFHAWLWPPLSGTR